METTQMTIENDRWESLPTKKKRAPVPKPTDLDSSL